MTLTQLFTAIANAIRAKKGTSETITASNFPTEIAGITTGHLDNTEYTEANDDLDDILENTTVPSGTLNITENGSYDVTNYVEADVNIVSEYNAKSINPTSSNSSYYKTIEKIDLVDCSSITSLRYFFANMLALKNINSIINTDNITNTSGIFSACTELIAVPFFNTNNVTNMSQMFYSCNNLVEIPFYNTSSVTNMQAMFQNCSKLTNDSLDNILQMCINATSYSGTKTLTELGLSKYTYTQEKIQALPHYQDFINAGWTTGY